MGLEAIKQLYPGQQQVNRRVVVNVPGKHFLSLSTWREDQAEGVLPALRGAPASESGPPDRPTHARSAARIKWIQNDPTDRPSLRPVEDTERVAERTLLSISHRRAPSEAISGMFYTLTVLHITY